MIKQGGQWQAVDWNTALELRGRRPEAQSRPSSAPQRIGALATPHSTVEELHLLAKLVRGLGSENIDHRTAPCRFRQHRAAPARRAGSARRSPSLSTLQSAFVIGSFLRKDHPLFAQRLRQAARKGAQIHRLHALDDDWLMPMGNSLDRRAERLAAGAGRRGRGRGAGQGRGRAAAGDARRRGDGHRPVAARRRAQGRAARQCRCAAPAVPASCWRWRSGLPSRPAPRSATWARPPTASARNWSVPCPAPAG